MRIALLSVALIALAPGAAFAADAPVAHARQMLRDANAVRLGSVDSVKDDGSVGIILNARYIVVPANTLKVVDGKLVTSLTKDQLAAQ